MKMIKFKLEIGNGKQIMKKKIIMKIQKHIATKLKLK